MAKPKGGKRPGAGRPKGAVSIATAARRDQEKVIALDKAAGRALVQQLVCAALTPLVEAQIAHARGLSYLVTRDKKTGKFIRVTEAMARHKQTLKKNEEIIEVWEKDPSVLAFTDLLNRALDKPAEQVQEIKVSGAIDLVTILNAARTRLANAGRS